MKEYVTWNEGFKDFLETQDDRWRRLLDQIEKAGADPITDVKLAQMEANATLDIGGQVKEFSKSKRSQRDQRRPC